jgi:hypothetical protein
MPRTLLALIASGVFAAATLAAPPSADARCRGCGFTVGGIAADAIGPVNAGNPAPPPDVVLVGREIGSRPTCHIERRRVRIEGIGYRWRTTEVCG